MKSRDLIFVGIVIVVVGGLYFLSTKNKAKAMSSRAEHVGVKAREDCMKCHTPAKFEELERVHKHPGKWRDARVSCLLCHTTPDGQKARKMNSTESSQLAGLGWRKKYSEFHLEETSVNSKTQRYKGSIKSPETFLPGVSPLRLGPFASLR